MIFYGVYWSIGQAVISKSQICNWLLIMFSVISSMYIKKEYIGPYTECSGKPDVTSHDDDTEPSITTCWEQFVKNDIIQFNKWPLIAT